MVVQRQRPKSGRIRHLPTHLRKSERDGVAKQVLGLLGLSGLIAVQNNHSLALGYMQSSAKVHDHATPWGHAMQRGPTQLDPVHGYKLLTFALVEAICRSRL